MAGKRRPYLAKRMHHADRDDDEHADDQQRGEHLSDDGDQTRLADGQRKHGREEQRREQQHVHGITEQRDDGHFIGGGSGTRLGDDHARAQDDGGVEHQTGNLAQRPLDGDVRAARRVEREDAQAGQRNVDQDEAQKADHPVGSAFHAQKRREDQVSGTEEHGEQRQTGDQSVFLQECSFMDFHSNSLL